MQIAILQQTALCQIRKRWEVSDSGYIPVLGILERTRLGTADMTDDADPVRLRPRVSTTGSSESLAFSSL